uniref:Uncharacterized protein n=1 Tax=Cajanus cajan TaxID=3821 RepID=A0A151RQB3_CAJCA|nr:hypothetical protein KK1_033747 [Cajanus cajan]
MTNATHAHRGLSLNAICPICLIEVEDSLHALHNVCKIRVGPNGKPWKQALISQHRLKHLAFSQLI